MSSCRDTIIVILSLALAMGFLAIRRDKVGFSIPIAVAIAIPI